MTEAETEVASMVGYAEIRGLVTQAQEIARFALEACEARRLELVQPLMRKLRALSHQLKELIPKYETLRADSGEPLRKGPKLRELARNLDALIASVEEHAATTPS